MKIRKLSIVRMPGFEREGFTLSDLSSGLNVVVGPNGSGKTTCCRAIQGLLWPQTLAGLSPVALVADWEDGGKGLHLELEAGRLTCQRDGAPAEPPPLPGSHLAGCFTITIDDLFLGSETDSQLAGQLWREMSGGYDLGEVRQSPWLKLTRAHGRGELDKLKNANQEAKRVRQSQEELRRDEDELDGLRRQELAARQAQVRLGRLDDARERLDVLDALDEAGSALAAFPAGMDKLRGNEGAALGQIESDLEGYVDALDEAKQDVGKAQKQIAEASLPDGGIAEAALEEQRAHRDALRDAERDLRAVERDLLEAGAAVASAAGAIGGAVSPERLDAIDTAALNAIEAFHRDVEALESRRSGLRGRMEDFGQPGPNVDVESLVGGIQLLRLWLEAGPSQVATPPRSLLVAALAMAGLLAAVGAALAVFVSPWWLVLLLFAAGGVAAALVGRTSAPPGQIGRGVLEAQFRRTSLPAPVAWDVESVGTHLNRLEQDLAKARLEAERGNQRQECRQQLAELEVRAAKLAARRAELIDAIGVAPEVSTLALVSLALNIQTYRQAVASRNTLRERKRGLAAQRDGSLDRINRFLVSFGAEPCESWDIADVRGKQIEGRAKTHADAMVGLRAAESAAQTARGRLATLQDRQRGLFVAAGLADGDAAGLTERLDRLDAYRKAVARRDDLKAKGADLTRRGRDVPDLLAMTRGQLDEEAARLTSLADSYRHLVERIADIARRVEEARKGNCMEVALAEVDWAREQLAQRRRETEIAAAGNFLLDKIEREHTTRNQPQVLREATRLLILFTRGRFELRLGEAGGDDGPAFRAMDTVEGRGKALDELSRGTRMQLLLALRLAFSAVAERPTRLPILLDEVLSSTDPTRFGAITECLLALVGEGRQVFYFTCQPGDAEAWNEAARRVGIEDARRIDLADVRRQEPATSSLLSASAARTEAVAAPDGKPLAEYARALGVPRLDPARPASVAHLAHLLDDAADLHRLLSAGISTMGQLRSLAHLGRSDAYLSAEAWRRAEARARVLDAFAEGWRIGRGLPLTPEALAAGGVSDVFLPRVTSLADDLGWDARRLIDALDARQDERARGFRAATLEQLAAALTEAGYIDERPVLTGDDLRLRVLSAANDSIGSGDINAADVNAMFDLLVSLCQDSNGR